MNTSARQRTYIKTGGFKGEHNKASKDTDGAAGAATTGHISVSLLLSGQTYWNKIGILESVSAILVAGHAREGVALGASLSALPNRQ